MNEITTTLAGLPEYEQKFEVAIINIVENKHQVHEREHQKLGASAVPLTNIHFEVSDFENNIGIPTLQEIAKRRGNSHKEWQATARYMLGVYCRIGEIEPSQGYYKLTKEGSLYKRLSKKLASTR